MVSYMFITLLLLKSVSSQINGEFWWLHDKVSELRQVEAPPPKFDDTNELETDESVKVVFRDNELYSREINNYEGNKRKSRNEGEKLSVIYFRDNSELSKPVNLKDLITIRNKNNMTNLTENEKTIVKSVSKKESYILNNTSQNDDDEFVFVFPKRNEIIWNGNEKNFSSSSSSSDFNMTKHHNSFNNTSTPFNNKVWFEEETKQSESESICTFINKQECIRNNGIIHTPGLFPRDSISNTRKICCILPLTSIIFSRNRQSDNYNIIKRYKRSNSADNVNAALKQRNALLERRQNTLKARTPKITATTVRSKPINKIVTPEYVDPYWNIKNSKFRNPELQSSTYTDYQNTKYDYSNPEYVEDYAVELPKPGLVGLYSDNEDSRGQTSWKIKNMNKETYYDATDGVSEEDEVENDPPFGYSTFDPRLGDRVSTDNPKPMKRKPQRFMITTRDNDDMRNSESQTISFHSTPDFHVLHGFKLVNLGQKNRYVRKTTEKFYENEEDLSPSYDSTTLTTASSNEDYVDGIDLSQQVYKQCGKVMKNPVHDSNFEKDLAESGCDPWLALVVLTKRMQSILCYATIIHQRAAVTAADCVHGKTPGEITTVSGVWHLKNRKGSQSRMSTVHTHLFKPGELANDLALLHWKRPLRIEPNVQPACLSDPYMGDDCYFVGWGGYDQDLQSQPHWQHATILTPQNCNEKISAPDVDVPTGAFCASVKTRGTVTGVGGPLLCKSNDRISIVGVAVYRDDIVVLLPTIDWIITALRELHIN